MKNINVNEEKGNLLASGKIILKKVVAIVAAAATLTTFAGCKKSEETPQEKIDNLQMIYLVPYGDDIYVLAKEQLDYDKAKKFNEYSGDTRGRRFSIPLEDGRHIIWNTEEVISIPTTDEGLQMADEILSNAGQEPISHCFSLGKQKTKIK